MREVTPSAPVPRLVRDVEKRSSIRARKPFPREPRVELFRLWPEVSKLGPRLRKHPQRKGVLIVEGSPRLKGIDPPGIKAEAISRPKLKKLEVRHELDGYYA